MVNVISMAPWEDTWWIVIQYQQKGGESEHWKDTGLSLPPSKVQVHLTAGLAINPQVSSLKALLLSLSSCCFLHLAVAMSRPGTCQVPAFPPPPSWQEPWSHTQTHTLQWKMEALGCLLSLCSVHGQTQQQNEAVPSPVLQPLVMWPGVWSNEIWSLPLYFAASVILMILGFSPGPLLFPGCPWAAVNLAVSPPTHKSWVHTEPRAHNGLSMLWKSRRKTIAITICFFQSLLKQLRWFTMHNIH